MTDSESEGFEGRCERVRRVLRAAARIANPLDGFGQAARRLLPAQTGLSPAGVELALTRHLETSAPDAHVHALVREMPCAPRVHVVLSANVFVGAVRALALAVASAATVFVRPSRREPVMASLLVRALSELPGPPSVQVVETVEPTAGNLVHAYGRQASLDAIARALPAKVRLWAHGPGMGIVIAGEEALSLDAAQHEGQDSTDEGLEERDAAERLSWDVIAFDQRGCLSPRLVLWKGTPARAHVFAVRVAEALALREIEVPRGALATDEAAQAALYVRSMQMIGRCWSADGFVVGLDASPSGPVIPPPGRHVHIACISQTDALPPWVVAMAPFVTTLGIGVSESVPVSSALDLAVKQLRTLMPGARVALLGQMQRPPLDGPVDRRCPPPGL